MKKAISKSAGKPAPKATGKISKLEARLRQAGLRATRPRLALGRILFRRRHRHVTADSLFNEAKAAGLRVSLATIYNTLHQFHTAGLVREVAVDSAQTYYDTNIGEHHHFYHAPTKQLIDIDSAFVQVRGLPHAPKGKRVAAVDVVVRLEDER